MFKAQRVIPLRKCLCIEAMNKTDVQTAISM